MQADSLTPEFVRAMLGREEAEFSIDAEHWRGRSAVVTGAGGFIGAELCRRLCQAGARRVIAVESNELSLVSLIGSLPVMGELADVRNSARMGEILRATKPDVAIHAAAYKHVGLLESFPFEAMENNAVAAARLADLAEKAGVGRFVLVSTDKAVEPVSVLGVSKRLAEMAVVSRRSSGTTFAAMRCGNVLGSPGSVVPIWMEQRKTGLPLTVTDLQAERFFVSRAEAARALLKVAAIRNGAGLFTYALSGPIEVRELLKRFADGASPEILVVGLAPGERRKELLHARDETVSGTECTQVLRVESVWPETEELVRVMREVEAACERRDWTALLAAVRKAIPSYVPARQLTRAV